MASIPNLIIRCTPFFIQQPDRGQKSRTDQAAYDGSASGCENSQHAHEYSQVSITIPGWGRVILLLSCSLAISDFSNTLPNTFLVLQPHLGGRSGRLLPRRWSP